MESSDAFSVVFQTSSGYKLFSELEVNAQTLFLWDISTWLSCCHLKLSVSKITHYLPSSSLPVLFLPPSLAVLRHKTSALSCSVPSSWSLWRFLCPYMSLGEFLVGVGTSASCCCHESQLSLKALLDYFSPGHQAEFSTPSTLFVCMSIVFFF